MRTRSSAKKTKKRSNTKSTTTLRRCSDRICRRRRHRLRIFRKANAALDVGWPILGRKAARAFVTDAGHLALTDCERMKRRITGGRAPFGDLAQERSDHPHEMRELRAIAKNAVTDRVERREDAFSGRFSRGNFAVMIEERLSEHSSFCAHASSVDDNHERRKPRRRHAAFSACHRTFTDRARRACVRTARQATLARKL